MRDGFLGWEASANFNPNRLVPAVAVSSWLRNCFLVSTEKRKRWYLKLAVKFQIGKGHGEWPVPYFIIKRIYCYFVNSTKMEMNRRSARVLTLLFLILVDCKKVEVIPELPSVSTGLVESISETEALCGGTVISEGNSPVTIRGVVWGLDSGPTIILPSKSVDGSGIGTFSSTLTDLAPGAAYFVRAYATYANGTVYGAEVAFTTLGPQLPTLTISPATNITFTSSSIAANVISGSAITARGVVWSTAMNPTVALSSKTSDGTGSGSFIASLTGLDPATVYYVRAYATNDAGTAYSNHITFVTLVCHFDLGGTISYTTVVTGAPVSIIACLPSVSGTVTFTPQGPGRFGISDISFGEYDCAWNDSPAVFIVLEEDCGNLVLTGADQYGFTWSWTIVSNNGVQLVIDWSCDYGDTGRSTLTRPGGWPLNLSM